MTQGERNPHAGVPFTDDDATIAAALEDVSVPALLCSLVHITGDPSWIRGDLRPAHALLNDYQGGMSAEDQAEARRRALPAIAAYRDGGCVLPPAPSAELAEEMMSFLACAPVDPRVVPMFLEDLHLDGADSGAIEWGDEVPAEVRADAHTVVIGCGEAGLLTGIRLAQAGVPFTIVEKNAGPGGTWWDNRYPGARVDIGSHFYCYSFEPSDHWTEYFAQQPELKEYFARVLDDYDIRPHCRFDTEVVGAVYDEATGRWAVTVKGADGAEEVLDARFVVSAVGALNQPKLPDIPGMDDFAGPSFHSARWDPDVDWKGTRFALVGRRRQRLPDRPDHRRRRRAPHRLPAHRAVDVPQRRTTTRRCRRASAGRCATCPSTAAGSGSSPSTRRRASRWTATASTPSGTTVAVPSARATPRPVSCSPGGSRPSSRIGPTCSRRRSRTTRRRPSACSRTTARGWRA